MFVLAKILWPLVAPGNFLLIALGIGAALLWTRRRRAGRALIAAALGAAVAITLLPVGTWSLVPLENRFPTVRVLPEKVDGIVVLGGAVQQLTTAARGQPTLNEAAERMTEFVALARRHPEARLVFTGGSALLQHPERKEAAVARALFAQLGLDPARIVFEDRSRNTRENALFTRDLVRPSEGETWVLVTSAFHMPRAYGCFSRVGWEVLPYPVDYQTTGTYELELGYSLISGLSGLEFALHEWVGLVVYRLVGHTDALFPRPKRNT